jgi:hypothetical protein
MSHIKRLNSESRAVEYPNTRPVDAATLIILYTYPETIRTFS